MKHLLKSFALLGAIAMVFGASLASCSDGGGGGSNPNENPPPPPTGDAVNATWSWDTEAAVQAACKGLAGTATAISADIVITPNEGASATGARLTLLKKDGTQKQDTKVQSKSTKAGGSVDIYCIQAAKSTDSTAASYLTNSYATYQLELSAKCTVKVEFGGTSSTRSADQWVVVTGPDGTILWQSDEGGLSTEDGRVGPDETELEAGTYKVYMSAARLLTLSCKNDVTPGEQTPDSLETIEAALAGCTFSADGVTKDGTTQSWDDFLKANKSSVNQVTSAIEANKFDPESDADKAKYPQIVALVAAMDEYNIELPVSADILTLGEDEAEKIYYLSKENIADDEWISVASGKEKENRNLAEHTFTEIFIGYEAKGSTSVYTMKLGSNVAQFDLYVKEADGGRDFTVKIGSKTFTCTTIPKPTGWTATTGSDEATGYNADGCNIYRFPAMTGENTVEIKGGSSSVYPIGVIFRKTAEAIAANKVEITGAPTANLVFTDYPDGTTYDDLGVKLTPEWSDATVTWSSSDEAKATITADGKIQPKAAGTTTIKATASGKEASFELTIDASKTYATSVTLDQTTVTKMNTDAAFQLTATVGPDGATDKTVTWSSSNAEVATVAADGTVTIKGAGTATITAMANGAASGSEVKAECTLTVNAAYTVTNGVLTLNADSMNYELSKDNIYTNKTWAVGTNNFGNKKTGTLVFKNEVDTLNMSQSGRSITLKVKNVAQIDLYVINNTAGRTFDVTVGDTTTEKTHGGSGDEKFVITTGTTDEVTIKIEGKKKDNSGQSVYPIGVVLKKTAD